MRTISNREFVANPEMYLGIASRQQDVRIRKGRKIYRLTCEPTTTGQPIHEPDDKLRRAISMDEFKERALVMVDRLDEKYARK